MKTIKVVNEGFFKQAPFSDVKMLGLKHLKIPADQVSRRKELDVRNLVRQTFKQLGHKYGEEFEIVEVANPFGTPIKRKAPNSSMHGTYAFVKNGLRAGEGDIRHEMMKVIAANTDFAELFVAWKAEFGDERYRKGDGKKGAFTFKEHVDWALKLGWIIRTGD